MRHHGGLTKARVHLALAGKDPRVGRLVAILVVGAIVASAVVISLRTLPGLSVFQGTVLAVFEVALLSIFGVEYGLRVWSAPSRAGYVFSFWGLVDLLSILPALVFLFPDTQVLRTLRLFRALRLLKLLRLKRAVVRIETAFASASDELLLFTVLAAITLFLAAVGIYQFEAEAQPETFGSIPASLWWAVATMTTVGYGDVYPVTVGGRIFTGLTLVVGLGIVAIPAAVITSALLETSNPSQDESRED